MAIREKAKKLDKILKTLERKYSRSVLPDEGASLLERFVFYLLFYANPVTNARKAVKALTDPDVFGDWNEVRVATVREIEDAIAEHRIEHAGFFAPRLKKFLQYVFEELDDVQIEDVKTLKPEKAKKFLGQLDGLPPWASTYLLCALGMESMVPWDPHTERVAGRLRIVEPQSPLPQRKKVLRAALQSVPEEDPLRLHHLFVEHGKKTCHEEDPKCTKCPISRDCDWYARRSRGGPKAAKVSGGSNGVEPPKR
jgi:endonuclease-3